MLDEAGVEVLYDTRVCLVKKDGNTVTGVIVHNKEGFCEITAKQVIDTTGDADVAALAGVPFIFGASESDVKEGFAETVGKTHEYGTMFRVKNVDYERLFSYISENPDKFYRHPFGVMSFENVKESYRKGEMCVFGVWVNHLINGRWLQIYNVPERDEAILLGPCCSVQNANGLDARNLSSAQHSLQEGAYRLCEALKGLPGFENAIITYIPEVGVRETRHIIGEYVETALDIVTGKDFPDSIACGGHPIDIHPRPKEVDGMDFNHWRFHIPYRVMLPKNAENLLVSGRCVSATRGASGAIRPTAQCMAMGEAAGVAAAMAVREGLTPKTIDVQKLRAKLKKNGAII